MVVGKLGQGKLRGFVLAKEKNGVTREINKILNGGDDCFKLGEIENNLV